MDLSITISPTVVEEGGGAASAQGKRVEYSLRAIPLGGYVAFPDDDPKTAEKFPPDDPDLLKNRSIPERALVISAGVLANCLFALAILTTQARRAWRPLLAGDAPASSCIIVWPWCTSAGRLFVGTSELFSMRMCGSAPACRVGCRWCCRSALGVSGAELSLAAPCAGVHGGHFGEPLPDRRAGEAQGTFASVACKSKAEPRLLACSAAHTGNSLCTHFRMPWQGCLLMPALSCVLACLGDEQALLQHCRPSCQGCRHLRQGRAPAGAGGGCGVCGGPGGLAGGGHHPGH